MSLVLAADAAFPFDYGLLPADCGHVLGYVGAVDATPHIWTSAQVRECQSTGRQWHPIWTVPQRALTAADGQAAAQGMVRALSVIVPGYTGPVFLDVERSAWAADPAGARNAVSTWQALMVNAGHPVSVPYLPWSAGYGWGANWTGIRPQSLPAGYTGWQYASDRMLGKPFDLSVFAPAVFAAGTTPPPEADMPLTDADADLVVNRLLGAIMVPYHVNATFGNTVGLAYRNANAALHAVADLQTRLGALLTTPAAFDPHAAAQALTELLGPTNAHAVAVALTAAPGGGA